MLVWLLSGVHYECRHAAPRVDLCIITVFYSQSSRWPGEAAGRAAGAGLKPGIELPAEAEARLAAKLEAAAEPGTKQASGWGQSSKPRQIVCKRSKESVGHIALCWAAQIFF